mgnify:CR=1 FL=1
MIGIYKITSPTGKVYIGQSIEIEKRFKRYRLMHTSIKSQIKLYNSFNKHGVENHLFEVILECKINELNNNERYYQDLFNVISVNGLNCRLTKSLDKSGKLSEETKLKIKKINSLKKNHFFGKKHTDDSKEKMRISSTGKKHTDQTKIKLTQARMGNLNRLGISHSTESKLKISLAGKGRIVSKKCIDELIERRSRVIFDTQSFVFYKGIKEVCGLYGFNPSTFSSNLNGTNKVNNTIFIYV